MTDAYMKLESETEESLGFIIEGIKSVISDYRDELQFRTDISYNRDGTLKGRIYVCNFPDAQSILDFSDSLGEKTGIGRILSILRV